MQTVSYHDLTYDADKIIILKGKTIAKVLKLSMYCDNFSS